MLDGLRRHTLWVRPVDPGWEPVYAGTIVRSVLGKALRDLTCPTGCRGACERGPGCPTHDFFVAGGEPPYRLDASALDFGSREVQPLHLVVWRPEALAPLAEALRFALSQGLGPDRVRFTVLREETTAIDLQAARIGETLTLVTPTHIRIEGWREDPTPGMIFFSLRGRLRQLGVASSLPWIDPRLISEPIERRYVCLPHHSQAQNREYPVEGWVGSWRIRPSAEQAVWLALAEAIGVGRGTTRGQGVVRVG